MEYISDFAFYCPHCGDTHFLLKGDEKCIICGYEMIETPHEYGLSQTNMDKIMEMGWKENKYLYEQNEQRLFDEVISKSLEFDVNLYNNKDSILKQQQQRQQEAIEHGKAILQGRDKGNKFGIECPYCHATNVSKITVASKAVHTALFGLFAVGRNSKNYHCDHCGSDF